MSEGVKQDGGEKEGPASPDSKSDYEFPRRLIVCLDGTWNQRDSGTNIYHLSNLVLEGKIEPAGMSGSTEPTDPTDPALKDPVLNKKRREDRNKTWVQMVHYDEGVGTGLLDNVTGGAFGIGLSENVRQAYDWLVERYRDGDHVYIFGFSRGAFTARSLVGMIAKCGLLYRGAPLPLSELWTGYQRMTPYPPPKLSSGKTARRKKWWQPFGHPKPGPFRPLKYLKPAKWDAPIDPDPPEDMNETERLLRRWSRRIPIECLAVYDTVGTFGIEALAVPWLRERRAQFHDTQLTTLIQQGFHGLAIDEHRANFSHIPWRRATELDTPENKEITQTYGPIKQRWFIGAHSNIGGSYDDDTLAQRPLVWFIEECTKLNLVFKPRKKPDEPDVRHETTPDDCIPLMPVANGKGPGQKPAHICDSYTQLAGGIWRHLLRVKRNYRRIEPLAEFQDGKEVKSLNEALDASVLDLVRRNARETGDPLNYNPPNLYEYRKRKRKEALEAPPKEGKAATPSEPLDDLPLVEPPHVYLDGTSARIWLAAWLFFIGCAGALIACLKGGGQWHWLDLLLPVIAYAADRTESYYTHQQALDPDGPKAETRSGLLDLLLDIRLVAVGAFLVGVGFVLWTLICHLWFPLPLGEAVWLLAFCVMMVHFNATKVWAARPMIDAGFGSILSLQAANTPEAVEALRNKWMEQGPGRDRHRLLPVYRTIWRDMIGFIPAYTVAFCAGLWITFSLLHRWWQPEGIHPVSLALLSHFVWCWGPAVAIAGIGAIADYLEDVIHLRHLREYDKKPPPARVLRGRIATKIKMGACIVGMFGFVAAVALLGLLQCYRALARAFPCLDSDQLRPYLPPACHSVPAIFGLAAAFVAVILAYGTVRAFLEPPEQTPP